MARRAPGPWDISGTPTWSVTHSEERGGEEEEEEEEEEGSWGGSPGSSRFRSRGGPRGRQGPAAPPRAPQKAAEPPPPPHREEEEQREGQAGTPHPLAPPAGAHPPVAPRPWRGRGGGRGGGRRLGGDADELVHERLPHRLLHGAPGGPDRGRPAASEAVLPAEEIPPKIGGWIRPPAPCRCQRPFRSPGPTDLGVPAPRIQESRPHKSSWRRGGEQPSSRPGRGAAGGAGEAAGPGAAGGEEEAGLGALVPAPGALRRADGGALWDALQLPPPAPPCNLHVLECS
ncbi:uncharacterized protein V3H86_012763 [Mergus octosetaceus]